MSAASAGDNVVLVDDLLATGGTAVTGFELVVGLGATVAEFASITELKCLDGVGHIRRYQGARFKDVPVFTLLDFDTITEEKNADPVGFTEESRIVGVEHAEALRVKYNLV